MKETEDFYESSSMKLELILTLFFEAFQNKHQINMRDIDETLREELLKRSKCGLVIITFTTLNWKKNNDTAFSTTTLTFYTIQTLYVHFQFERP